MVYELIAAIAAGFAAAGIALVSRSLIKTLPRWLTPIAAGAGMLGMAIFMEYGWFDRTTETLPDGIEVALTGENRAPWRPWTYAVPFVDRFLAVDTGTARTNPSLPDQKMVDLLLFARWQPPQRVRAVVDCANGRRADLHDGVSFAENGALVGARWLDMGLEHPVTRAACGAA